jgi:phospholipase D1/2
MDRDEHGQHRIPILMNYLKLKISDSIHPFHATHAVFKIELEYGDGLLNVSLSLTILSTSETYISM